MVSSKIRQQTFVFFADFIFSVLLLRLSTHRCCILFADMLCFCDSCSSLSGIEAPLLYLWCMAGITNFQLMEKIDEVKRRIDGQDETLKSIQSSLVELTLAVKTLKSIQSSLVEEVKGYVGKKSDEQQHKGESSSAIIGKKGRLRQVSKKEYEEKRKNNTCLYCMEKYTQGHKCKGGKLSMLICPDAKDGEIDNDDQDYPIMEENDVDKMPRFPKPGLEVRLKEESSLPIVNIAASRMEELKQMLNLCKKTDSEFTNHGSSITRFDIFTKKVETGILKLKTSLLVNNRGELNFNKGAAEGSNMTSGSLLIKAYNSCDARVNFACKINLQDENINAIIMPDLICPVNIAKTCRELGIGDGGLYRNGANVHLTMMCLDMNWDPLSSAYSDTRRIDNYMHQLSHNCFHDLCKRAQQGVSRTLQAIRKAFSRSFLRIKARKITPSVFTDIRVVNFGLFQMVTQSIIDQKYWTAITGIQWRHGKDSELILFVLPNSFQVTLPIELNSGNPKRYRVAKEKESVPLAHVNEVVSPPVDLYHHKEYMCLFDDIQAKQAKIQIEYEHMAKRQDEMYTMVAEMCIAGIS